MVKETNILDITSIDKAILKLQALKKYYQTHNEDECLDIELKLLENQLKFWTDFSLKFPKEWKFVKDYIKKNK